MAHSTGDRPITSDDRASSDGIDDNAALAGHRYRRGPGLRLHAMRASLIVVLCADRAFAWSGGEPTIGGT